MDQEKNGKSISLPVDLIRTAAIIFVIVYHAAVESYAGLRLSSTQSMMYYWSATFYESLVITGVPLFVILSGTLLLQPSKANEPIGTLLKKRLSRIGYAFAFWSAVYFAWSYFADHTALTFNYVVQSLLANGAYPHFWFIYLITGLYLVTPILRVLVAHAERKILRYLIILWFIGIATVSIFQLVTGFSVNSGLFLLGGYVGYFVMGLYLMKVQVRPRILWSILLLSILVTFGGTWLMSFPFNSLGQYYFFFYTLQANVIIAAVAIFLILSKFPANWPANTRPRIGKIVHAIGENTLPIYLFHIIILLSLERGYFGFTLSLTKMNPFIEVPIATAATLFITLGLVIIMKKVPILKKLIG